ncbi:MAG: type II secretion system protein N, partial [Gammaproteobacteria bacterium]|nr:type II secretion system protein N [Gammaproteobacteria bacterium]
MIKLAILGIFAFLVSLIVTAPAHLADEYLPPDIHASNLQGTVWQGQASQLRFRGFDFGQVSWELRPHALLLGRIQADVSVERVDLRAHGNIARGLSAYHVFDAHLEGGEQLLAPIASNYGVTLDGPIEADIDELAFNDVGPQAADGLIVWRDARLVQPASLSLGDVNVSLAQEDIVATAQLSNTGEALNLNGNAQLRAGWTYDVHLQIAPTPATSQQVRDTLPIIGEPDARGAVTINRQGTLAAVSADAPRAPPASRSTR